MLGERKVGSTTSWNRVFFSFPFSFWCTIGNCDSGVFVYSGRKKSFHRNKSAILKSQTKSTPPYSAMSCMTIRRSHLGTAYQSSFVSFQKGILQIVILLPVLKHHLPRQEVLGVKEGMGNYTFLMWVLRKSFPSLLINVSFFQVSLFWL